MIIAGIEFNSVLVKALNPVQEQAQQSGVSAQHETPSVAAMHAGAGGAAAPAAAPKPAGPAGMRQPRPGHRYVTRKWNPSKGDGGGWDYCYAGEEGCGGPKSEDQVGVNAFPHNLEHTMEYNTFYGAKDPEHAYKTAIDKAVRAAGTKFDVHHPRFPEGLQLRVITHPRTNKSLLAVYHKDGTPVMTAPPTKGGHATKPNTLGATAPVPLTFKTRGEAEKWWLESSNSKVIRDHEGRDWIHVIPKVGRIVKGSGYPGFGESNFHPNIDPNTGGVDASKFSLAFNPTHPHFTAWESYRAQQSQQSKEKKQQGEQVKGSGHSRADTHESASIQDAYRLAARHMMDSLNLQAQQVQDPAKVADFRKKARDIGVWLRRHDPKMLANRKASGDPESQFKAPEGVFDLPWDNLAEGHKEAPITRFGPPGSVSEKLESGELKHRYTPDMKNTELDVSPEEKHKYVNQVLRDYWKYIQTKIDWKARNALARTYSIHPNEVTEAHGLGAARAGILGADFDPAAVSQLPDNFELSPTHPQTNEPHPIYQAIAQNMDRYPHVAGYPFSMQMASGRLGGMISTWNKKQDPSKESTGAIGDIADYAGGKTPTADEDQETEYEPSDEHTWPEFWVGDVLSRTPGGDRGHLDDMLDAWQTQDPYNQDVMSYREQIENLRNGQNRDGTPGKGDTDITPASAYKQIRHGILSEMMDPEKHNRANEVLSHLHSKMNPADFMNFALSAARNSKLAPQVLAYMQANTPARVVKSFELQLAQYEVFRKALNVLQKDKGVDPGHKYAFREGDEDHPRFYFNDASGNVLRYTNAPTGESDRANHAGDPKLHPSEPSFDKNPAYFTPDGRKLTRCPECEAEQVEWNSKYNRYDPSNLWAARWRDKKTGAYRYSYIHSDIRNVPKLQVNQQNIITDVRLPQLRAYYTGLYHQSDKIKDQLTGIALSLLDQGRCRAIELAALSGKDLQIEGSLVTLGARKVYVDPQLVTSFSILKNMVPEDMPLFSVPMQTKNDFDYSVRRRMGPHYWARILDMQGMSLLGLQTYHATMTFSREVNRLLMQNSVSWDQAEQYATLVVALEWGHDLTTEADPLRVLQLVQELLVDPIVVQVLKKNAQTKGLLDRNSMGQVPSPSLQIPYISMDLTTRLPEEKEFSQWLHAAPVHEFADIPMAKSLHPIETLLDLLPSHVRAA